MARATVISDKLPRHLRAGTHLSTNLRSVMGPGKDGGRKVHGIMDLDNHLFQTGGEAANFIWQERQLISLAWEVWEQVRSQARWIEFVDHVLNVAYRVHLVTAIREGEAYEATSGPRIGKRFGIPVSAFRLIDADGNEL